MPYTPTRRLSYARALLSVAAVVVVCLGAAFDGGVANGRIPSSGQPSAALMSPDAAAVVTGGGTVIAPAGFGTAVASFGLNAKRPPGFTGGGAATGRINYNKHAQSSNGRHTNLPVMFMEAETSSTPTPNGTGGKATLSGNCGVPTSECPTDTISVLVYVEDNGDSGGGVDIFRIYFCSIPAFLPDPNTFNPTLPPPGCQGPEGGYLRSGNIQERVTGPSGSAGTAPTAARAPLRLP